MFADRVLRDGLLTGLLSGLLDGLPSGLLQRKKYCAMVMMRRSVGSPVGEATGLFSRLRTGQRALSFHRCPFLLRKGWKGVIDGLFRYEGWEL